MKGPKEQNCDNILATMYQESWL